MKTNPDIKLIVRGETRSIKLDVKTFPILCPSCESFSFDLFEHTGSRYGYVAKLHCKCGEELSLSDGDNIVEYIDIHSRIGKRTLNFYDFYNLTSEDFEMLKVNYGYDIFRKHLNETISLAQLVGEIEELIGQKANPQESDYPLPQSVKMWKSLINKK